MGWRNGRSGRRKYFARPSRLGFLIGALLLGVKTDRRRLAFRCDDGMSKVPGQWRPEPGDVAGNPGIILRQRCQAIRNIVVVRAVELVRRRIVRVVAPKRPQHRTRDEQQG
jgi:hypothetical protein